MSDFPYLGNRISLISSSQIRYEGILYTIDTVQGTVTLAQVRSFGTEDRPTERPVAERDEIYDFIVFRGSDIKDIKLCNVQKTYDDPAIVEMGSSTTSGGAPGGPLAAGGRLSRQPAFGAAVGGPAPGSAGFGLNGAPALAAVGGAVSRLPQASAAPGGPLTGAAPATAPGTSSESSALISTGGMMDYAAASGGGDLLAGSSRSTTPSRRSPTIDQGVQTQQDRQHRHREGQQQQQRGGYHNNSYQRGGGVGGFRSQRGPRRGGRGQSRGTFTVSTRPIKFDCEFDFEEANKQFEELAAQLAKTKISSPAPIPGEEENGEAVGGDEEPEEGELLHDTSQEETPVFYNKTKSFFDNISCDAIEKARDNRQRRSDWQKERKQNMETFGVEGTRRPYRRGGYGRGYYNNRGGGGGGGYYNNRGGGGGGGGGYYNNRGGGGGYYNNRGGGYRGYYNNYNRGYGGGGGRRGGGDGTFQQRGGRPNQDGRPAAAEAAEN